MKKEIHVKHEKKCMKCNKRYYASYIKSKYCSSKCRQAAYRNRKSAAGADIAVTPKPIN